MTRITYVNPITSDGKKQHVPIVCKNKDVLLGHINTTQSVLASLSKAIIIDNTILSNFDPGLDSSRFNNIIDDGLDATGMPQEEMDVIMQERIANIFNRDGSENQAGILDPGFFSVDCRCSNFIKWNNAKEIPSETFKCDICDRVLIHYIYLDDEDIIVERK